MKRPERIRILGLDVSVELATPKNDGRLDHKLAYADICRSRIVLNENHLLDREAKETLLHEVIHHIDDAMKLDFSEDTVGRLSRGLYAVMHDNPQLVEYLMDPE
jgi:hypothetical protein